MACFGFMAKVHLLCTSEEDPRDDSFMRGAYTRIKQSADLGKSPHVLVDDPKEADIIFFAEMHISLAFAIMWHPTYKAHRSKCFGYGVDDYIAPLVPGVYPSIDQRNYSPRRVRSGMYLSILENPYTDFDPTPERDLLYSFVGSVETWPIRAELEKLQHPRSVFIDTSKESLPVLMGGTTEQRTVFWKRYADIARRSKFVLCPRGKGPSSIRLFEMMRMGRAPVILGDAWVPPSGPQWEQFSIRIPESDVKNVPKILEARESEFLALGLKARHEWERWFSPDAVFTTIVDWCLEIKAARRLPEVLACAAVYPQLLQPRYARMYYRNWKHVLKEKMAKR